MNVFVTAVVSVFAAAGLQGASTLEEGFANPPDSAKPHTWYHMMNVRPHRSRRPPLRRARNLSLDS